MSKPFDGLDPAALHPALKPSAGDGHHYRQCARRRESLRAGLAEILDVDTEQLVLLHNTSTALVSALFAVLDGTRPLRVVGPPDQHYPPYLDLLPARGSPIDGGARFHTHISPLTGRPDATLSAAPVAEEPVRLVDGAQSLGTLRTDELLAVADLAVAPLHKHLGLATGLGVVVLGSRLREHDRVRTVLRVLEDGCRSLSVLDAAITALESAEGRVLNRADVVIDEELREVCDRLGLRLLAEDPGIPLRCVTSVGSPPVSELLDLDRLTGRYFAEHNVLRFSFHVPGTAAEPASDCGPLMRDQLLRCRRSHR